LGRIVVISRWGSIYTLLVDEAVDVVVHVLLRILEAETDRRVLRFSFFGVGHV
jgi:hypothetical protein